MKTDGRLTEDVIEQLSVDPAVDSSCIAVAVHEGVVTLSGTVPSYWQKGEAENTVKSVTGVRAVANDVNVEIPASHVRNDTDIAADAASALGSHSDLPDRVKVGVRHGQVRLTGTVDWHYQRAAAENAVRHVRGVTSVINEIELKPRPKASDIRERIKKELARTVDEEMNRISVKTSNGRVTLSGTVRSWSDDAAARRAAWSAPGVTHVEDRLVIG